MICKSISIGLLLAAFNLSSVSGDDEVWPAVRPDLKYRKLYQFQMNNYNKMIDEFVDMGQKQFRLDLISEGQRISYLSNGKTGEVWRYKPFVCNQLEANSQELGVLANLFQGYSSLTDEEKSPMVYGLGPLWLRASSDKSKMKRCKLRQPKGSENLICWETSMGSSESEPNYYVLRFYFRSEKLEELNAVVWYQPSSSKNKEDDQKGVVPVQADWKKSGYTVTARVKLVSVDTNRLDSTTFQLPLGYGCQRKDEALDRKLSLNLLEPGTTQQVLLEVVLSRNLDDSHVAKNNWVQRRHMLRLMRGSFDLNNLSQSYYVAVDQSRDAGQGFELKRQKRVWSAQKSANEARVYTLNEVTGECRVEPMALNDIIRMSFPNSELRETERGLEEEVSASVGLELIHWLFEDVHEYHLVREQLEPVGEIYLKISLYEKRILRIQLNDKLWTGPASIVKKITTLKLHTQPLHVSLSVFFYSDDLTKILDKLVINLLETDLVDTNYMHKLMDISACFEDRKLDSVIVKYPLESQQVVEALEKIQEPMQELLLSNLFQMTPVEPLQVSNVELSFDHFYMYFKFDLLDLPLTETFALQRGLELNFSNDINVRKENFMEKVSANVEKCATSCAHYNCLRFSYNSNNLVCRLEFAEAAAHFKPTPHSDLYTAPGNRMSESSPWNKLFGSSLGNKPYPLKPAILLNAFKELTKLEESSPWDPVPLVLRMRKSFLFSTIPQNPENEDQDADVLLLKPISVQSEMDSVGEIGADGNLVTRESELRIEYSVLMEGREFKKNIAFEKLDTEVTYEVCAQSCEASDCRSFSFCENKQTCSLTNLHSSKDIESATDERQACKVFVMDYLSKFEDFGPVMAKARVARVVGQGERAADCATACMEETSFACQGFYHCQDQTYSCYLQDKHALEENSTNNLMLAVGELKMQQRQKCRLYSRSYLSHFNDYYGKALKEVDGQPQSIEGLGAELCAQMCIKQSCLAFHVCHESTTGQVACQVASYKELRRDQMEPREHCTTFALSDKSQYNLFKKKANFREPDKQSAIETPPKATGTELVLVDKEQEEAIDRDINRDLLSEDSFSRQNGSKIVQLSNWFESFLFGSLLGVCFGLVCKKHYFLYSFTTRTFSQYTRSS